MNSVKKEFDFTQQHFNHLRDIVTQHSGIVLSDAKQNMVYSRLTRRLRKTGSKNFDEYCALLEDERNDEFTHFVNAITTNLTSFFRENYHFIELAESILPEIMLRNQKTKKIRVWSAGCSTGMETYSIAMVLKEVIPENMGWDVKILATDLDTEVIDRAKKGIYPIDRVSDVSQARLSKWFIKGVNTNENNLKVSRQLRNMVSFKVLNLLDDFPFNGLFDIIFCRNVVIYFDKDTQRILFEKFANIHADKGFLFIGHSETLYNVSNRYRLLQKTIYHKVP